MRVGPVSYTVYTSGQLDVLIHGYKMDWGQLAVAIGEDLAADFDHALPNFNPNMSSRDREFTVGELHRQQLYARWSQMGKFLHVVTQVWSLAPQETTVDFEDQKTVFDALVFLQKVSDLIRDEVQAKNGPNFGSAISWVKFNEFVPELAKPQLLATAQN